MFEELIAVLCAEARDDSLDYSYHFSQRVLEGRRPDRSLIKYILCDNDPMVIEPDQDERGKNILIWGMMETGRVAHVLCSYPPEAVVITAYFPDTEPEDWADNYRRRVVT